jgi:hypothetical protein
MGTAIDLNYGTNPYVLHDPDAPDGNAAFRILANNALEFSGLQVGFGPLLPYRTSGQGQVWDHVNQLDRAIELYFSMLSATPRTLGGPVSGSVLSSNLHVEDAALPQARANVRALLMSRGQSPTNDDVEQWVTRIRSDFQTRQNPNTSNWLAGLHGHGSVRDDVGIMNLPRELPIALCDVAGLRWGASGFGEEANGDIQHFDASEVIHLAGGMVHDLLMARRGLEQRYGPGPVEGWRRQDEQRHR